MIFDAEAAVARYAPQLMGSGALSVACVQTTRPKYLVFNGDSSAPACVVQFGPERDLRRTHDILATLEPRMPGLVPAALACEPWSDGVHVQILSGLEGMPWFALQNRVTSTAEWFALQRRAARALGILQHAVRQHPGWTAVQSPAAFLAAAYDVVRQRGVTLSRKAHEQIDTAIAQLQALGSIRCFAQHGDYSLNNVLLSADGRVRVIDFDEFGLTWMPLHDETGLALSMAATAPARCAGVPIAAYLRESFRAPAASGFSEEQVFGMVLHHLLSRINSCAGIPRRARMQEWLAGALEDLVADAGRARLLGRDRYRDEPAVRYNSA